MLDVAKPRSFRKIDRSRLAACATPTAPGRTPLGIPLAAICPASIASCPAMSRVAEQAPVGRSIHSDFKARGLGLDLIDLGGISLRESGQFI
jgi:hypothetical protein